MLPGPFDSDGLPESVRFWKARIEESDPDRTFRVGVLYGPSGCGKSSLLRAGVLPRLAGAVVPVVVEATAADTEGRLLAALRRQCPYLPPKSALAATLRKRKGVPAGKKVLIVIDQFEQWLHAHSDYEKTELVEALRECDGESVQCLVAVRDDFWTPLSRFFKALKVEIEGGRNASMVDLFDADHAKKVLADMGRAFGKLNLAPPSGQEAAFLDAAVSGLAQDGRVICVRLVLLIQMFKGREWTPAALREVGGTEGVGAAFLEETFSARAASPRHRAHQVAARNVLNALLPEQGTDIRGHMRSSAELLEASGYASRPKDFDDLIRILDGELRLITPTDPEGKAGGGELAPHAGSGARYYQLTHDYLVPALRDWLTRKQKETRRGRAELLLADRAAVWNFRQENRHLPSLSEWFEIRWQTQKEKWTPSQRKMMTKAAWSFLVRFLSIDCVLALVVVLGISIFNKISDHQNREHAEALVQGLLLADTAQVPPAVSELSKYRVWAEPRLREENAKAAPVSRQKLNTSLALLPWDATQAEYLYERLLNGDPQEVVVIRVALSGHKDDLTARLWELLENPKSDQDRRLRAACALSAFTPDDPRWEKVGRDVAATLVIQKPFVVALWTDTLKGMGRWLLPPLAEFLVDESRGVPERGLIASVYGTFAAATPDAYLRLENQLAEQSGPHALVEAEIAVAKRQVSVGAALLVMGKGEKAWPLMRHQTDPTMRSYMIERLAPSGVDPKVLMARLSEERDVSVKRAILLSLGGYGPDRLSPVERQNLLPPRPARINRLVKSGLRRGTVYSSSSGSSCPGCCP